MNALSTLLESLSGLREIRGQRERAVGGLCYDSRRVEPGDLFVAVNGRDDRALTHLPEAVAAGAGVVVVDTIERPEVAGIADGDVTLVVVDDARRALAEMAWAAAGHPERRLTLYGVTGTNGKTTTAWVLRQLLEEEGTKVGLIGTLGQMVDSLEPTGYTTPEAPELAAIFERMVHAGLTTVAMEVSSHALALDRVWGLPIAGAIFTNLSQDHLDFHTSMQDYRDAKKLLFDRLDTGSFGVVNLDDPHGADMVRDSDAVAVSYGTRAEADARIRSVELRTGASRWEVILSERLGGGALSFESPLVGGFNVMNVTAAATLALAAGVDRENLVAKVSALRPVPGRMESVRLPNGAVAVIDYAHSPDALSNVLVSLRQTTAGAITVLFGCGGDRDRGKRPQMGEIAARLADRVVVTSDNPRSEDPERIIDDILAGLPDSAAVERLADRAAAIERALDLAQPDDVVLIAGKGHEEYQIAGGERRHFSDREEVMRWVNRHESSTASRSLARG